MINAGDFDRRITIISRSLATDSDGFNTPTDTEVCRAWANVNTTKGYTLVSQGTDFEQATTRMLIRKPSVTISRKHIVLFHDKEWSIRYLNDVDETGTFIELQVQEVTQNG